MQVQNYFRTATILFYEGRMEEALNAINRYLEMKPSNSLGFNNRALIHFHMGNCSQAREDLTAALQFNHLNYVGYFNLFSVLAREGSFEKALFAVRAALSCLYLIKGRLLKDKELLTQALQYSSDNLDALLLLALLEVGDKNYDQSLVLIEAYQSLNQHSRILQKLGALIKHLQVEYSQANEEALYDYLLEASPVSSPLTGKGIRSISIPEEEFKDVLDSCVSTFNRLYSELNQRAGGASYLIAKTGEGRECGVAQPTQEEKNEMMKKKEVVVSN